MTAAMMISKNFGAVTPRVETIREGLAAAKRELIAIKDRGWRSDGKKVYARRVEDQELRIATIQGVLARREQMQ